MIYFSFLQASQMWELYHILPLVIGDDIPPDDSHYLCFMKLQEVSTIVFSPLVAVDQIPFLRILIQQYLEEFTTLYPHFHLPPKSHYLVHLPTLIQRYAVLVCVLYVKLT